VTGRLHRDEIDVDESLVRRLLGTLTPAYDGLPLRRFEASGSTNALFRLGDDLLVRMPRQPGGSATIEKEQRWLPHLAPHLPVPVPEIVAVGEPGFGYPETWSVVRFLDGTRPGVPEPDEPPRHALAAELAAVVRALGEVPVPAAATSDPTLEWYRGGPLASMCVDLTGFLQDCRRLESDDDFDVDLEAVRRAWDAVLELPEAAVAREPRWYHGDLNAENVLVSADDPPHLAAVLDFGALSVGDPTNDLAVAWQLLDPAARRTFRCALGVDDATWAVGRGWALVLGMMPAPYYWDTMRERCLRGLATVTAVLDELSARSGP
jgi:aminoglycoside phosphotransferase (APT) family kinase protein